MSEMSECPVVTFTRAIPAFSNSSTSASSSSCTRSRDHTFAGSSVSDTETSDVATQSTEMPALSMMLNTFARKPYCPSMRVLTMSSIVTFFLRTIEVSSQSSVPPGRS